MSSKKTFINGSDVIEIASHPNGPSGDGVETDQHRFIVDQWDRLAAAAYEGYQRFGVGAVVLEEEAERESKVEHPFAVYNVWYATSFSSWMQSRLQNDKTGWAEAQFETYDPSKAGVFMFLRADAAARTYLVEASLTPPEAFERAKALLN